LGLVLFVSGFAVCSTGKHFLAEAACPTEWNSTMNLTWDPELSDIEKAIAYNPCNFEYHYKRAGHFMALNAENEKDKKAFHLEVKKSLEHAVCRNPSNGILWYELGNLYSSNKYDLFDYLNKWLPLADECFDAGIKYAPMDEHILFNIAWYWVWRANLLPERKDEEKMNIERPTSNVQHRPSEIENKFHGVKMMNEKNKEVGDNGEKACLLFREAGIHNFQHFFQRSLALNPVHWKKAAQRIWTYFPDDAVVLGIVPESNKALKSLVLKFLAESESSKD
jgi:tetratricopeptide (TPR) repeat protein